MKAKHVAGMCLLALLAACGNGEQKQVETKKDRVVIKSITKHYNDEPKEIVENTGMVGTEMPIDTVLFRYAYRLRVNGDRAVIMDLHGIDHYYHVFTYPEFKYLSSFGSRGEGPNESLYCENIRFVNPDSVWVLDNGKNRMLLYSGIREGISPKLEQELKLDKRLFRALEFDLKDGRALIPDYSGEFRFCWTDMQTGKMLEGYQQIPAEKELLEKDARGVAIGWHSFLSFSPDKRLLVTANQMGERIDIYNLQTGKLTTWEGKAGSPTFRETGSGGLWYTSGLCHHAIQVTEKHIYTVFNGRSFETVMREGDEHKQGGYKVRVHNHQGKLQKEIELDRRIVGIYVDEKAGILYGLDVNADEQIVKWKL